MANTKSLIIADIKEVLIRNLYREEKNYKQPLYKCTIIAETNVADTMTPSHNSRKRFFNMINTFYSYDTFCSKALGC